MRRRTLLVSGVALVPLACARPAPRAVTPTPSALPADFTTWRNEASAMLSDALEALRTFDAFQAFRASTAPRSSPSQSAELVWDAPTRPAWDEATHVARGMHGRADQLATVVRTAQIDPSLWREQRATADSVQDLLVLAEALMAYRDRVDVLPPGDASGGLGLLDKAWTQWDIAAGRWGVSRGEPLACG